MTLSKARVHGGKQIITGNAADVQTDLCALLKRDSRRLCSSVPPELGDGAGDRDAG